ncbi:hypothetical protein H5410_002067 [Solanum commersonii]|uniref:Uncharacterized protein n=1 Tax=Solanum commersonii TaxID=4109 RepID=A0A9J6B0U5_SOLCO|nr:hypothetical protein H5410_002067 [Solanum commersonii]
MMRAYSMEVESLKLFEQFQEIGLKPDKLTFPIVLKVCGHCLMIGTGQTAASDEELWSCETAFGDLVSSLQWEIAVEVVDDQSVEASSCVDCLSLCLQSKH